MLLFIRDSRVGHACSEAQKSWKDKNLSSKHVKTHFLALVLRGSSLESPPAHKAHGAAEWTRAVSEVDTSEARSQLAINWEVSCCGCSNARELKLTME